MALRCTKIPHLAPRGPILESTWEKGRPAYRLPPRSGPYFGVFLDHKWDPKMCRKMSLQKYNIGEPRGGKNGLRGPRKRIQKGRGGNNLRLSCRRDKKKKASGRKNEQVQKPQTNYSFCTLRKSYKRPLHELELPSGFSWTPLCQQKATRKRDCKKEGREKSF